MKNMKYSSKNFADSSNHINKCDHIVIVSRPFFLQNIFTNLILLHIYIIICLYLVFSFLLNIDTVKFLTSLNICICNVIIQGVHKAREQRINLFLNNMWATYSNNAQHVFRLNASKFIAMGSIVNLKTVQ